MKQNDRLSEMITKNNILPFFDILKIKKYMAQISTYKAGNLHHKDIYDFQSNIHQNKD